jgi:single-strand DNA-binding protein
MPSFNKVILIGNLTRDPEMRVTPKGTAICQFGLAINRNYKSGDGEPMQETTFVDCEAWEKRAETISKYCTKGAPLMVEGRLKLDEWEDKQSGQRRSKLKVVVENFQFLGSKQEGEGVQRDAPDESQDRSAPPRRTAPAPRSAPKSQADLDEDVPF